MKHRVILLLFFSLNCYAQQLSPQQQKQLSTLIGSQPTSIFKATKRFTDKMLSDKVLSEMKTRFGKGKIIPKQFEKQILTALSFYPELKDCNIEFIRSNIKTTMACRPSTGSLLKRYNRDYIITIDSDSEGQGIVLENVPFNAQIGVIGHELAHIVDYEHRTATSIAKLGLDYAKGDYPPSYEKEIDKLTIKKGLGWQLYDWSDYVLNQSKASKEYKEFKRKSYLTPEEIRKELLLDSQYHSSIHKPFWRNDFLIEVWGVCLGVCLAFIFQADFRMTVITLFRKTVLP